MAAAVQAEVPSYQCHAQECFSSGMCACTSALVLSGKLYLGSTVSGEGREKEEGSWAGRMGEVGCLGKVLTALGWPRTTSSDLRYTACSWRCYFSLNVTYKLEALSLKAANRSVTR